MDNASPRPSSAAPVSKDKAPSLKEQYVPLEERESQHISSDSFIREYAVILSGLIGGAIGGFFLGRALEPRSIKLGRLAQLKFGTDTVNRQAGLIAGAEVGGILGIFSHWKKREGKQLGVKNISIDLHTVMEPQQLENEVRKQDALLDDLNQLESRLAQSSKGNHAQRELTRRENKPEEPGITS